ncbi:apoptosis regulator Bcl-2-like [Hydractinia symbiolongicarpus]|uniref:apoptosis regulator Bcl-2-like n=1 Tax=Hydractinia symbiolongicarpus TaxID=13093 RepID=UPI00254CEB8F|nr:apoptosis regulator Bcl-2-like [Hydractinia symbiolongicarpus]
MTEKIEFDDTGNANNTPEGKIAREVASQYIAKKVGKPIKNIALRKEVEIMLRLTDEIDNMYDLANMCNRLNVSNENAHYVFMEIAEEIFQEGINWGRIIVLYAFAGKLAQHFKRTNNEQLVDKVGSWVGTAVSKKSMWVRDCGHGWTGFIQAFGESKGENENNWFQGMFAATIGFGTLAAAMLIKS